MRPGEDTTESQSPAWAPLMLTEENLATSLVDPCTFNFSSKSCWLNESIFKLSIFCVKLVMDSLENSSSAPTFLKEISKSGGEKYS